MKKLNKIFMLGLAASLIISTLAGCVGDAKKSGEPIAVKAWTPHVHSETAVLEYVAKVNDTVLKDKGYVLIYQTFGNDYTKTLDMAIANDQAPELFSGAVSTYASKKQLRAIEELPGGQKILDMYPEMVAVADPFMAPGDTKPKIYTLYPSFTTFGMVYNKDLFKKAGIVDEKGNAKAPKTWAEVREDAKKLTDPQTQEYGLMMPFKWAAYTGTELMTAFGPSLSTGVYDYKTGKYDFSIYKPVLEWWLGIREDKSYYPGPEGIDNDPARAKFSEGKVGMKMAASYDVAVFNVQFPATCDWGVVPFPVIDEDAPKYKQKILTGSFVSASAMAPKEKLPAMVECLKLLYSEELQQLTYERGMNIPVNKGAIDNAKNVTTKTGWKEFGEMVKISEKPPMGPMLKIEGDNEQAVYMKVWSGMMTIDEALADLTKRSNDAYKKGVENGEINAPLYIKADYERGIQGK